MFRFAIKVGLASGAVYCLKEEGIWKESSVSLKAYDKLNTNLEPYVKKVKAQIPFELPKVPHTEGFCDLSKQYWNKGVTTSIQFLSEIPCKAEKLIQNTTVTVLEHPDVKKILEGQAAEKVQEKQT